MKKPIIALLPLYDSEKESYWMLPGYMKGIEKAGGIPVMLPLCTNTEILDTLADQYDGFLFTGGQDVSPGLYKVEKSALCGEICKERDQMEKYLLERVLHLDKPILGICRGIQILNAVLGGTLYQDLPTEHPSEITHRQKPPYDKPAHNVQLMLDSPLFLLLKKLTLGVNSCHHQAIKELSSALTPMAYSEDGLTEAVYKAGARFVWAVQWHPEFSYESDENSLAIFREFIKRAAQDA